MYCVITSVPTLAVSTIYCLWFAWRQFELRRRRLCERVTYMLWVMANRLDEHEPLG